MLSPNRQKEGLSRLLEPCLFSDDIGAVYQVSASSGQLFVPAFRHVPVAGLQNRFPNDSGIHYTNENTQKNTPEPPVDQETVRDIYENV